MAEVILREITREDLDVFFEHQRDAAAVWMAAFTAADPTDRDSFDAQWTRVLGSEDMTRRTILLDDRVVGHVMSFEMFDNLEITYWVDRAVWGQGVATAALQQFLTIEQRRPLHARAATDNVGSVRVLNNCGFTRYGEDRGFANARNEEVDEYLFRLD